MHLTISPIRGLPGQPETALSVAGDMLTCDGVAYDLSSVPEGGEGWPEGDTPIIGPIRRIDGVIHATIRVTLGDDALPSQPIDPAHWVLPDASGPITIPAARKPEPEEVTE